MSRTLLASFQPHNTALFEARLWHAYYDRRWLLSLSLLFRLLRTQFGIGAARALRAAWWGTLAGLAWVPLDHDLARVRRHLLRFYQAIAGSSGTFHPAQAAEAELHYWDIHRALSGRENSPELVESLSAITVAIYGLSSEAALPAALLRARACDLVDRITSGRQAPAKEAWDAIAADLRRSYSLLAEALRSGSSPSATGAHPARTA